MQATGLSYGNSRMLQYAHVCFSRIFCDLVRVAVQGVTFFASDQVALGQIWDKKRCVRRSKQGVSRFGLGQIWDTRQDAKTIGMLCPSKTPPFPTFVHPRAHESPPRPLIEFAQ